MMPRAGNDLSVFFPVYPLALGVPQTMCEAVRRRKVKVGEALFQEVTRGQRPQQDPASGLLHWPVVLCYPEPMAVDLIQDFCETDTFGAHLRTISSHHPTRPCLSPHLSRLNTLTYPCLPHLSALTTSPAPTHYLTWPHLWHFTAVHIHSMSSFCVQVVWPHVYGPFSICSRS